MYSEPKQTNEISILWLFVTILVIVLCAIVGDLSYRDSITPRATIAPQFKVTIYRNVTTYEDILNGQLFLYEVHIDETIPYACDGWQEAEDNGQNCVIVSPDGLREIVNAFNLPINGIIGE